MSAQSIGYVSVIGFSLLQAVVALIEQLEDRQEGRPNDVQTSEFENGYAASIIMLTATVAESALNRTRYVRGDAVQNRRESVTEYWTRISGAISQDPAAIANYTRIAADLDECFAVRDAIAHSHLWEAEVRWNASGALEFVFPPVLRQGYGDRRFRAVMEPQTRQSRRLALNLFPSRIWRRDAWAILNVINDLFIALESVDRRYHYLSPQTFQYRGAAMHFGDIIVRLPHLAP